MQSPRELFLPLPSSPVAAKTLKGEVGTYQEPVRFQGLEKRERGPLLDPPLFSPQLPPGIPAEPKRPHLGQRPEEVPTTTATPENGKAAAGAGGGGNRFKEKSLPIQFHSPARESPSCGSSVHPAGRPAWHPGRQTASSHPAPGSEPARRLIQSSASLSPASFQLPGKATEGGSSMEASPTHSRRSSRLLVWAWPALAVASI